MAAKIIYLVKLVFSSVSLFITVQFFLNPTRHADTAVIMGIIMAVVCVFHLAAEFILMRFKDQSVQFSLTSLVNVFWFTFITFIGLINMFRDSTLPQNLDFLKIIAILSGINLTGAIYSSFRNIFSLRSGFKYRPYTYIMLSFALVILTGSILLFLPVSREMNAAPISYLDALFTATSAVCVTGLTVFDIGTTLSPFGQIVLLLIIQIGGLGLMTFTAFFTIITGEKMTLSSQFTMQNAVSSDRISTLARFISSIILSTLIIELAGALVLLYSFSKVLPLDRAVYYSVFHSISAFCNAGFSPLPDNLMRFRADPVVNIGIMSLIILGGIGFGVIVNVVRRFSGKDKRLFLHSKIVLTTTFILISAGALVIWILEKDNLFKGLGFSETFLSSLFASVTARTAGFNTVNYGVMRDSTLFFTIILMFIGASPGSTGGGVKTTSFVVMVLNIFNILRDKLVVTAFRREIPFEIIRKATVIILISLAWVVTAVLVVSVIESKPFIKLLFETVSAFGTVGLSTGITAELSPASKTMIMITMFLGRLGPITLMYSLGLSAGRLITRQPEEKISVG